MFRNHYVPEQQKMCKGAEIGFRFTEEKEQEITWDYTYESDRVPVYTFDSSAFIDDITGVRLSTKDFYDKMVIEVLFYRFLQAAFRKENRHVQVLG